MPKRQIGKLEDSKGITPGFRSKKRILSGPAASLFRQGKDQGKSSGAALLRTSLFSGALVFSFGAGGLVPGNEPIPLPLSPGQSESETSQALAGDAAEGDQDKRAPVADAERCYWQEDVRVLASVVRETEPAPLMLMPCVEGVSVASPSPSSTVDIDVRPALTATLQEMTAGYPLEAMAPFIARYDHAIAGLIVGIAKKESNWGKRVPRDNSGADCFNYWGYKGAGTRGMAMGYGCFGTPEEAVSTIGNRLEALAALRKTTAPAQMIAWKCGSSCASHSSESVRKWIADVSLYYYRIAPR